MNTTPYTITKFQTNSAGFPIDECSRCNGSGTYSYNPRDGHRCFGCQGEGVQVIKKARDAYNLYVQAIRDRKRCQAQDLQIGDSIAINKKWCEVLAITVSPRVMSYITVGTEPTRPSLYLMHITLLTKPEDEYITVTKTFHSNNLLRRHSGHVDPTPFFCMIPKDRPSKVGA